jgi:hypothetical protein
LKGNFVFLGVLTAKIDVRDKLAAIKSLRIQIERFQSSREYTKSHGGSRFKVKFFLKKSP